MTGPGAERPADFPGPGPWALGGAFGAFLRRSATTLAGRVVDARSDGGGAAVTSANPALGRWLTGPCPARLADALTDRSLERWRRLVGKVRLDGRARATRLVFSGHGGARRRAYRCLVVPGLEGEYLLLGEPLGAGPAGSARRAWRLARTDPLTGLANRRQADRWLAAVDRGGAWGVVVADLDRLKAVNDTLGHPAGDAALRAAGAALRGAVRAGDRLARLGGDEFLVLLPGADTSAVGAVAARLVAAVSAQRVEVPGSVWPLTVSVGAAVRAPGEPAGDALARADAALRLAKRAGGGRFVPADG